METLNLKALIEKLNNQSRQSLEQAAGLCLKHQHYNVELAHWGLSLLEQPDTSFSLLLAMANIDLDQLKLDLYQSLDSLKTGNNQAPAISNRIIELINTAWLITSLDFELPQIHTGILLVALFKELSLRQMCFGMSAEFKKLTTAFIAENLSTAFAKSKETLTAVDKSNQQKFHVNNKKILNQYTLNLNDLAKANKLDPAIGREQEVRQMIDILSRRRQNNVMLAGEPGVGKTALVEGLALRIVSGDVPENLSQVVIHSLDIGLMQAGAGIKGEFENRLKQLIEAVQQATYPIILFIDEAHTLIGAGNQAGGADAANLLKPALARGELRSIAATTWSEYKQYFEKDAALTRRFQVVKVEEPNTDIAIRMLRSLNHSIEQHHGVKILDEAIVAATKLSQRYITSRQLPDKSISVLDTACARVASKQRTTPELLEQQQKLALQLQLEMDTLQQETLLGLMHQERLQQISLEIQSLTKSINTLKKNWQKETELVDKIKAYYKENQNKKTKQSDKKSLTLLKKLQKQLKQIQQDKPLLQAFVDKAAVAEVIEHWTGIPAGNMLKDDVKTCMQLDTLLKKRIVGQDHAIQHISQVMQTSAAKLADPNKPRGVFLLIGPSGVGKTETALALADAVFGSSKKMTVINMSEFKEEHKISMLTGAPAGYVGYGEGGVLTEAVRQNPYSLILLDEIEKAHPGVQDVFYQVFDKGIIKDGQGRDIDFRNTVIILTSNAASNFISEAYANVSKQPALEVFEKALTLELKQWFKPAFLGRVNVIAYHPLSKSILQTIIQLKLDSMAARIQEQHGIQFIYNTSLITHCLMNCTNYAIGARQIDHFLAGQLLPEVSNYILKAIIMEKPITTIQVSFHKKVGLCFKVS